MRPNESSQVDKEAQQIEFQNVVIQLLTRNLDNLRNSEGGKEKIYEARAVKKYFERLLGEAMEENKGWSAVLIGKFLAYELKRLSFEAGIASEESTTWMFMFSGQNPEPPTPEFQTVFAELLQRANNSIKAIQETNFIVLSFDRFKGEYGDQKAAIETIVWKSSDELEKLSLEYGFPKDDFYRIALEYIESQRKAY